MLSIAGARRRAVELSNNAVGTGFITHFQSLVRDDGLWNHLCLQIVVASDHLSIAGARRRAVELGNERHERIPTFFQSLVRDEALWNMFN